MWEWNYFVFMMLKEGDIDVMVLGYVCFYLIVVCFILEIIGKFDGVDKIVIINLMFISRGFIFLLDIFINIDLFVKELVNIV